MDAEKLAEIKNLVRIYSGLQIKGTLEAKFNEAYKSWIIKTGNNPYKLLELFQNDVSELREFISDITINESYFFRNMEHFKCLESAFTLLNKRKKINILSVGCANGCEPYSIAIYIHKNLPALFHKVTITGIDISNKIIETAKAAVYQNWYLRHTQKEYIDRYFTRNQNNDYEIIDEIKDKVTFHSLNILDFDENNMYDIIFCRNFLIYFDEDTIKKITSKINNLIKKDGFILFGNSDILLVPKEDFLKKGCLFQKIINSNNKPFKSINDFSIRTSYDINLNSKRPKKDESEIFKKGIQFLKVEEYTEAAKEFEFILNNINPKNIRAATFLAYSYYKLENLKQAQNILNNLINKKVMVYEVYLLNAIINFEKSEYNVALDNLRKTLFINPDSEIAWFYLGKTYEKLNEIPTAVNAYTKALSFANKLPEDRKYSLAPEITVSTFKEWLKEKIETLS